MGGASPGSSSHPPTLCPQVKDGQPPVEASKAVKLSKLPPLLVVHMQRFAYDSAGIAP